jgi:hypothetical protein
MHHSQQQEKVFHVSGDGSGSVTLRLETAEPVTVRLQVEAKCGCVNDGSAVNLPGSYVYTDPAGYKN